MRTAEDDNAFERVLEVLAGARKPELGLGEKKMARILWSPPTDVIVAQDRFEMQWVTHPRRRPHRYFPRLAPGTVFELMRRLGVDRIEEPVVGVVQRSPDDWLGERFGPVAVWVVPGSAEIRVFFRAIPNDDHAPTRPIPEEGPWALPEPAPEWQPPRKTFLVNEARWSCPHCGAVPERFRELSSALICPECGRSFDRPTR